LSIILHAVSKNNMWASHGLDRFCVRPYSVIRAWISGYISGYFATVCFNISTVYISGYFLAVCFIFLATAMLFVIVVSLLDQICGCYIRCQRRNEGLPTMHCISLLFTIAIFNEHLAKRCWNTLRFWLRISRFFKGMFLYLYYLRT
jgi:hypothetical protein